MSNKKKSNVDLNQSVGHEIENPWTSNVEVPHEVQQEIQEEIHGSDACCNGGISADQEALSWLQENCSVFTINSSPDGITVSGVTTKESKEGGYQVRPVIRKNRDKPPYFVHPEDTYQDYRSVGFSASSKEDTLASLVELIIITYCPGDVEIAPPEPAEPTDRHAIPWVLISTLDLEEFQELPTL